MTRRMVLGMAALLLLASAIGARTAPPTSRAADDSLLEGRTHSIVKRGLDAPATPRVSLGVNCLSDGVGLEGRTLLFRLILSRTRGPDKGTDLILSNPGGGWSGLIHFEIRDAANRAIPGLRVMAAEKTDAKLTLTEDGSEILAFAVETAPGSLPPGEYTVVAILDATKSDTPGAWHGLISSAPRRLSVRPQGASLTEGEADVIALTAVRVHSLFGRPDSALQVVDRILAADPRNSLLLEEKGDVLSMAMRYLEAVAIYDSALAEVRPQPESPLREPPAGLMRKREEAARRIP